MEQDTLATELLHELKLSARRWFIAFCIMVALEVGTVFAFLWYISLPIDESVTTQTVDNIDSSDVRQVVGDYNGESDTDSILQEESSSQ